MGYKIKAWSKAPREWPTSSGNPQPQTDVKASGAKQIGQAKGATGRPSGQQRTATGKGVRFNLEEANHATWDKPQKGIPEVE